MQFLDKIAQQNVEKNKTFVEKNTTKVLLFDVYGHYFFQSKISHSIFLNASLREMTQKHVSDN